MRSPRKTGCKAKAASGHLVSVHPGSPQAESGLFVATFMGAVLLLQSPLDLPLKAGTVPVRENP
jgi:hypothetical protein